ncbi:MULTISPECIES: alpha-glucuronidase [unclassified Lacrimispora]|uniref:alpha-glucuronidase n=1 Tax=unclassified Lacrimispora TaxID=2719232 RepID=UPI003040ED0A|nr:alpha-glucuronidase [Lachnospiraceae bacterium]
MSKTRDLCWLKKKVYQSDISGYHIKDKKDSIVMKTIERELPLLFEGAEASDDPGSSLVLSLAGDDGSDGYEIKKTETGYGITASTENGLLYGVFSLHRILITKGTLPFKSEPDQSIRMINHWDNFDGSIERGYAGESIYYDRNNFRGDMEIVRSYARLLASTGINSISINNVNVHRKETSFIKGENLKEIRKIADVFSEYGIRTYLAINFAAPIVVGGLDTADPLEPEVAAWWENVTADIYKEIPQFGGFIVKADSEGEPGPFTYNRTHEDGANMLARAIKPLGGIIIWRCFVYNCAQDWRDRSLDRARAAYDIFMEHDGKFEDNVILQIKNGPIDFQIREPNSPLFGALKKTNQILEFQITQEYTGHQIDICYLVPMWKETLDFDTCYGKDAYIRNEIKKNSPDPKRSGIAAVGSVGMDTNWTGNKLAQANLYGYGRLVWGNSLSSDAIAGEWVNLTFDLPRDEAAKIKEILTTSRGVYEDYTCPLAVGFMCKPTVHYGVDIDGYEYDKWGTYHYADRNGVGRERTVANGTGYTRQYSDDRFREYEDLSSCPDELLLFFHHVPYTHILRSGKTVIQHIYDTHFAGVEKVEQYESVWESLEPFLDEECFSNVRDRLKRQKENAINWRDQINTYFYRKSGIPDAHGRKIYE